MKAAQALGAWIGRRRIGTLAYDNEQGLFAFHYANDWASDPDGYPLSPPLGFARDAKETDAFHSAKVRRFFANLLPEGEALDDAARASKVSKSNLMGLMRAIGRETSGAISLLPADASPDDVEDRERPITAAELSQRIRERSEVPFSVWDGKVRISIAGLQDKIAVYRDPEGELFLVEGRLASTHILKPAPRGERTPFLIANEHFCMRLAAELGIPAAPVEIMRVPEPILLVERFDRQVHEGAVIKTHLIDGCQALDLGPGYKYERHLGSGRDVAHIRDGASYPRLFGLTELTASRAATRLKLLRWALFQYLIGNSDAHGKNISFFVRPYGLTLAPAYDLVAVNAYDHFETDLAMAIGDTFAIQEVRPYDWADFAHRCGINARLMAREMQRLAEPASKSARGVASWSGYTGEERQFLELVLVFVDQQARQLLRHAAEVPKIRREHV
ncbi:MAG: HipA domain-containing protein [Pseudomonadota bacterium]